MGKYVHHFHPLSGLYLATTEANQSPEEPGVYACPAHATFDAPPDPVDGKAIVWRTGAWTHIDDCRGTYYDSNGREVAVTDLAVDVGGLAKDPRPSADHVLNDGVWVLDTARQLERLAAEVRAERNIKLVNADIEINRLEDAGNNANAWRAYRVWLRNVPQQSGFPTAIDWGTTPT